MKRSVLISAVIGITLLSMGPVATAQQRGRGGRSAGNQPQQRLGSGGQGFAGKMQFHQGRGNVPFQNGLGRQGGFLAGTPSTASDMASLTAMWAEEKLARDVYQALAKSSQLPVFRNIAAAESKHMQAVANLLGNVAGQMQDVPGVFTTAENQQLYDQLVALGLQGDIQALQVGAKIEEMDIADLRKILADPAIDSRTRRVLENLERGSRNHLTSFASQLTRQGATYEAQFLTQTEFDKIANSPQEKGNAAGRGKNGSNVGQGRSGQGRSGQGRSGQGRGEQGGESRVGGEQGRGDLQHRSWGQ